MWHPCLVNPKIEKFSPCNSFNLFNHRGRSKVKRSVGRHLLSPTALRIAAVLIVILPVLIGNTLGTMMLFNGRSSEEWKNPGAVVCTKWLNEVGFAGSEMTCSDALKLNPAHIFPVNERGQKSHYAEYMLHNGAAAAPGGGAMWVHFHGVNGSYLHGARYYQAAQRLGFNLVAAEYVNHGLSSYDGFGAAYGCKESSDVVAVLRDVLSRHPDRRVLVSATSMGTMAVALAERQLQELDPKHQIAGFALESPITSLADIVREVPPGPLLPNILIQLGLRYASKKSGYNLSECTPMAAYSSFSRPTLVQHSATDELAPVSMAERVFAQLPDRVVKKLKIYPSGRHSAAWNAQMRDFEADIASFWRPEAAPASNLARSESAQR
jgi:pimeloyl-ACP methyl ester carboxylesterase